MCLEAKNQNTKNDWFIYTLKNSKNARVRSILEAEINKGSANAFKGFESPTKV